jgi:hypothetical protein
MHTRRDFLKTVVLASPAWNCISRVPAWAQVSPARTGRFPFGASVYPDIDGGGQSKAILDLLERAHMNVARGGESSFDNLELAPGKFNFGWLLDFLNQMQRCGIWSFWGLRLTFRRSGWRRCIRRCWWCSNRAPAGKFHDHPAVIGWQLDNEIEFVDQITQRSIPAQLTLKPYETLWLDAHVVRFSETLPAI